MDLEDESTMELSDAEKHTNYLAIAKTIEFIQSGGRITEDWTEEHKRLIRQWREWISDFSQINEEREDAEFRKLCNETETIMRYIYGTLNRASYLDVKAYLLLLQHMKKIIDMLANDDEMEEMMKMLSM